MSFQIATATSFADLAQRLVTFLTATGHAHGKTFTGTGTGDLTTYNGTATSVAETWTLTATSATNFTVSGSVSGAQAAATVGTPYTTARLAFTITAGGTPYIAGDIWRINTSPPWTLTRDLLGAYTPDLTTSAGWTLGANVFDKNVGTFGTIPNASLPGQCTAKLVKAVEILEIGITPNATANAPNTWTVQWSDDGISWTTASTYTGISAGWIAATQRRFAVTASGAHVWWRINISAGNTTPVTIGSVDFYHVVGGGFSIGNDWVIFVVRPPGNDGLLTNTSLCVICVDSVGADTYGLYFVPITSYDPAVGYFGQPGYTGQYTIVSVANFSMQYWLTVNGRRLALGVKVSTTYQCGYYGLMLPYARPSVYALPLFIGGSSTGGRWSGVSETEHNYWRANSGALGHAGVRDISGIWRQLGTHLNNGVTSAVARMMPNTMNGGAFPTFIRENFDGTYPLLPLVPVVTGVGPMGELDGVFWTTGFGTAAEAIIRLNRIDHVVFQNVFRTTIGDYAAQRLD